MIEFLSPELLILSLAIASITYMVRVIYAAVFGYSKWWNKVILPIFPILLGAALGYCIPGLILFPAIVAGALSSIVFRTVKSILRNKGKGND